MAAKPFTSIATARAQTSSRRQPRGGGRTRTFDHYLHRHEVATRGRSNNIRPPGGLTTIKPVVDEHTLRIEHVVAALGARRLTVYERFVKPALDRMIAALLLALFLPVLALTALAVWVTLGSPIMLRQPRIGRHGHRFGMFKFRTMRPDRRRQRSDYRGPDRRMTHKSADDPRHTRLGRKLRKTSLDELPQLLNVLRGDMSLIGPRPELAEIVAQYQGWQHGRHAVKPGITGLWQVTERPNGAVMHECTEIDLAYIQQLSLRADAAIMFKTPLALLRKDGVV